MKPFIYSAVPLVIYVMVKLPTAARCYSQECLTWQISVMTAYRRIRILTILSTTPPIIQETAAPTGHVVMRTYNINAHARTHTHTTQ